jgi:hypothetical protein
MSTVGLTPDVLISLGALIVGFAVGYWIRGRE